MFKLNSPYKPTGDQPEAIRTLVDSLKNGNRYQTLLGVTGSGKTFTMANIISELQRPALIMAHNKTLAAQLAQEFKEFFPENAVHYFVSYYDYYQPEAFVVKSGAYIEKEATINEEIDRLTHELKSFSDVARKSKPFQGLRILQCTYRILQRLHRVDGLQCELAFLFRDEDARRVP